MSEVKFYALVDYEDSYVLPIILDAMRSQLPPATYKLIHSLDERPAGTPLLQFRSYEAIDFELGLANPRSLFNSYIIRKALIRKHFLANTISSWITKNPSSILARTFKPAVDFELDYAEFLDDALLEAFELHDSFAFNADKAPAERQWWILKPGMSDRGQGIRLFSTEDELRAIFEEWEAENDDSDEDDAASQHRNDGPERENIMTSHLRHFIAQPYIEPPLLISDAPFNNRKFHIRTYVVAKGALEVFVFSEMLALFATEPYQPPWLTSSTDGDADGTQNQQNALQRFRNVHLTNTCVQSTRASDLSDTDSVHLLSTLPLGAEEHASIQSQIRDTTASLFQAAVAHPTHFQPLPQSFEIYGVDFLVSRQSNDMGSENHGDTNLTVSLLEVNAFPDFAQTGHKLRDVVIRPLFESIFRDIIAQHFDDSVKGHYLDENRAINGLIQVLSMNLGKT